MTKTGETWESRETGKTWETGELREIGEGGAPERGDPPKGGVGDAPDHSSSTGRRLSKRGF